MTKPFSDNEKTIIRDKIRAQGNALFARHGLRKTSLRDITKAVGIGLGTFYHFYSSKEELFIEIIEHDEKLAKESAIEALRGSPKDIRALFKAFVVAMFSMLDKNVLMKNLLMKPEEFSLLIRTIPQERMAEFLKHDDSMLNEVLAVFKRQGISPPVSPKVFSGIFRSMYLMSLNKDQIGKDVFDDVMMFFAEAIEEKLTKGRPHES
jgi:AcrR family transcriptional regulator